MLNAREVNNINNEHAVAYMDMISHLISRIVYDMRLSFPTKFAVRSINNQEEEEMANAVVDYFCSLKYDAEYDRTKKLITVKW